ncbi:MAG: ADP-ribosylglycohydrolase family protein [Candidatus Eisenbacteria bacterium]|nr:ADP-ribosylglycohydrolase family protein [Candidatus Eisenbacteria bacterium]
MGRAEALRSLRGLSVGDAYGQSRVLRAFRMPVGGDPGSWPWTDATHTALSVVEALLARGALDPDTLATALARRYGQERHRGYAVGAVAVLEGLLAGEHWSTIAPSLFGGQGSYGSGAAQRAAPVGAFFAGDPPRAAMEIDRSSVVTHSHLEGRVGAVAVAVAAAMLATPDPPRGDPLLRAIVAGLPKSRTRAGIEAAVRHPAADLDGAASALGTGRQLTSVDTVPFCLWVVARHGRNFERAVTMACEKPGAHDALGAIVGGLAALLDPRIPPEWLRMREPLPRALEG